ncbi:hypothetical protein EDB92DRAFT_2116474 [Lactarius akahatsu]|uniref:Rho-GAP domain-containing protein n=1 Tax=Lactarius akahatsu TaxID=416441 RepID=A0AAD4LA73_9AGAM|nr:hypothetical protein EDB92DRAFT_2116474 [Lactarius akahatsu]
MSFISVEPQSRVLLETHSNSLLTQFDTQLEVIADRYLAFFRESIHSLRNLHRKAKIVDSSFDLRAEPTTTRAAWDSVRDSLEKEANAQQAFVDVLDNDVIKPLVTLKASQECLVQEMQDETRTRIEEDLQKSAAQYANHAENKISKLQQAYLKKYFPRECAHSIDDLRGHRDIPTKKKVWRQGPAKPTKPPKSEEVSDDDCRRGVSQLNIFRLKRAETLGEGYDVGVIFIGTTQALVLTTTVKDVLGKYPDGIMLVLLSFRGNPENLNWPRSTACAKYDNSATKTKVEVKKALAGTDTSDLRASFRRSLSFSIPPLTLYRDCRPGAYSELIFGVPLVDLETDGDNVPKVMRMCIEEVEKRGLNIRNMGGSVYDDAGVLELRRRFESDKTFSFSSTEDIHSVTMLLGPYLWDLPEPMFMLSFQDYRDYRQNRARYTANDFSILRSKIRKLHPVQRASLGAFMRHLLRVAAHSDKNAMTIRALATLFRYHVLRGNEVLQDGVYVKTLVMEDLIQNAYTLFDEHPSPSPDAAVPTSTFTYGSLFLTPELPQTEVQAIGSTTRHRQEFLRGAPTSAQPSFSSLPSDTAVESHLTPSPTPLLSPLLGFPSSQQTLTEMTMQEPVTPEVRGTKAVEGLAKSPLAEVVSIPPTSVAEWRSRLPRTQNR